MKTIEKLTVKAVAERLNGREYMHEVTNEERNEFSYDGITVVVGASDDNVEFYGYIDDEIGCWEDITIPILDDEILKKCSDDCEDYDCPLWRNAISRAKKIRAQFTNDGWKFDADFPHEKFIIMEDGEVFGEGLVFSKEDLNHEIT